MWREEESSLARHEFRQAQTNVQRQLEYRGSDHQEFRVLIEGESSSALLAEAAADNGRGSVRILINEWQYGLLLTALVKAGMSGLAARKFRDRRQVASEWDYRWRWWAWPNASRTTLRWSLCRCYRCSSGAS